jgi:hypothetical protein
MNGLAATTFACLSRFVILPPSDRSSVTIQEGDWKI